MNSEIKNVEKRLQKAIESNDPILREASSHLLSSGGKRVRPAFVILSSQFGPQKKTEDTYRVAVALELIHMATINHSKKMGCYYCNTNWKLSTSIRTGTFI